MSIQAKVQELGDLELAVLVCLVARQHCLFYTTLPQTRDLQEELRVLCRSVLGLHPVVVECSSQTSVEEFSESVLVTPGNGPDGRLAPDGTIARPSLAVPFTHLRGNHGANTASLSSLDERRIADVVIATNLDLANESVQAQALELIRTRRIFTRTAMHTASKDLMILAIASSDKSRLSHHLNDMFCMSHLHSLEDGLPYMTDELLQADKISFSPEDISNLRVLADEVHHTPEIAAYLHNIVIFMRNSRYIQSGVTATATRHLRIVAKALAPLHGLRYVPPSLVTLAVRKIYPHRIRLATPATEPSLQWGSNSRAVSRVLNGLTVEDVIEDVLATVETPL